MSFHTSAALWAFKNAVHSHELTLAQGRLSFNPAWKSALKAVHLTGDISGSGTFRKRRESADMSVQEKERMQKEPFWLFYFFANSDHEGKRQAWGTMGEGSYQLLRIWLPCLYDPNLLSEELVRFSCTHSRPESLSTTFRSHVLGPGYHGPHSWTSRP